MDNKMSNMKVVFDKVRGMREEISTLFEGLDGRISKLHEVYNDFIRNTKLIKTPYINAFVFSLDSFYFQNSLLKREYKFLKDYYIIIINRMYSEYYKLYKLIIYYVEKSHIDTKLNTALKNKKYPKYDDLDEEKLYDFNLIVQLNEDIIYVLAYLINVLRGKEQSLQAFTTNQSYGLNVDNFVSTFKYEVIVLDEQINLYEKYLNFFYNLHEKLLKRLITKIRLLEAQLKTDIKFEGGLTGKRIDNTTLMNDINIQCLNKNAARDLRRSIVGESSPSGSSSSEPDEFLPINHIPLNESLLGIIEQGSSGSINITHFSTQLNKSLAQQMFKQCCDISDEQLEDEGLEHEEKYDNCEDTAGEDTAGEDTAGEDTAGEDTAGEDTAGEDTSGEQQLEEASLLDEPQLEEESLVHKEARIAEEAILVQEAEAIEKAKKEAEAKAKAKAETVENVKK
jgi:hypothetical protein